MGSEKIDAEKSLCWKCKHGVCVQETEQEFLLHSGMTGDCPGELPEFDLGIEGFGEEPESAELSEHVIEHERVKTVCFWLAPNAKEPTPILGAKVTKCSGFELDV